MIDCRPGWDTLDLSSMDVESAPSLTIFAKANPTLPSLEEYLIPLKSDKKPC